MHQPGDLGETLAGGKQAQDLDLAGIQLAEPVIWPGKRIQKLDAPRTKTVNLVREEISK